MKSLAREAGAQRIVLGHTADDQAETMLMWMLRGAGLTGLAGMPFVREAQIVRPLLSSSREDILAFLKAEGLSYREDSSNATDRFRRNRIRTELLPVVTRIAPAAIKLLQRQADLLREDERYLDQVTQDHWASLMTGDERGAQVLDRRAFSCLHAALQRRLVRWLLRTHEAEGRAPSINTVELVRRFVPAGRPGSSLVLRDTVLKREGDRILCIRRSVRESGATASSPSEQMIPVTIPSAIHWAGTSVRFQVQILSRPEAEPFLRSPSSRRALFDADRFSEPLLLRSWRSGDRFQPCGMRGKSKKLQDLFTDLKIARDKRAAFPVLAAPEGILWVAGLRQDERFIVRDGSQRCLAVTMVDTIQEGAS
jgi:tRNA(Ile)-lysidine synthase